MLSTAVGSANSVKIDQIIDFTRFSNYPCLIRTTAFVLRFIKACRKQRCEDRELKLTKPELDDAERCWMKCLQTQFFHKEINSILRKSKPEEIRVIQFGLFLDQGILKCRGRINNSSLPIESKNPMLPYK